MGLDYSGFQPPKCVKNISQLPDCVLSHILSLLSLREAAATSVLSKPWRDLWLSAHRALDFDTYQAFDVGSEWRELDKYADWVNRVLASHKLEAIDELRIRAPLMVTYKDQLGEWLSYAAARKVKRLEVDLLTPDFGFPNHRTVHGFCSFPSRILKSSENLNDFRYLRSLRLFGVDFERGTFQAILKSFRFLEHLKVCKSSSLSEVRVRGSSLALKHLEIDDCYGLGCITLRDALCLVSLKASNVPRFVVENAPNLVDVSLLSRGMREFPTDIELYTWLSRLEVLTIQFHCDEDMEKLPALLELKELNLIVSEPFPCIKELTMPNLEKFVMKVCRSYTEPADTFTMARRPVKKCPKLSIQHLKIVEVIGYTGCESEDDLIIHLYGNAADLKSITLDCRDWHSNKWNTFQPWTREIGIDCARKLKEAIPKTVEFNIV